MDRNIFDELFYKQNDLFFRLLSYVPGDVVTAAELENDIIFQAGQLAARVVTAFKVGIYILMHTLHAYP